MRAKLGLVLICLFPVFAGRALAPIGLAQELPKPAQANRAAAGQASFGTAVAPLLAKYCTGCHGPTKPKGGLNLAEFRDDSSARSHRKLWERVREYVEGGLMPPEDRPQPSHEEAGRLTAWIKSALKSDDCGRTFDPGHVTIRRLNRAEYNNTIRDLIGIDSHLADDFPSDDVGYGFDNIGDVLTLPPILMEKYLAAAEKISTEAIVTGGPSNGPVKSWNSEALVAAGSAGSPRDDGSVVLTSDGEIAVSHQFPRNGSYLIRVRACGDQAGPEPVKMAVRIDGKDLKQFNVPEPEGKFHAYQFRQSLRGGTRRLSVAFLNDFYAPNAPDPKQRDRNLIVESIEVEGPLYAAGDPTPDSHRRIVFTTPKTKADVHRAASAILERFAGRAFRRPAAQAEVAKLVKLVELAIAQGDPFERGIQLAVQAVLISPDFLFRVELDSRGKPTTAKTVNDDPIQWIGNFELASRLSYFLWSSLPDDELWRTAVDGSLRNNDVLEKQVRRMLRDPKSQALVDNFAGQWLQFRNLRAFNPDRGRYPAFDDKLRDAMIRETELFFEAVMRNDLSILDFLDSDFTHVNERLARHYGIPGVKGDQFRRVKYKGRERGGLLTQASILTVTSNPTRTSPVKRGKWVLEQLLGTPPPPPPPNVPLLTEDAKVLTAATLRLRMEQHRSQASCAVCHSKLDPLGFGLENFDAVGGWRDTDAGVAIDSSGKLPSGESFRGPKELRTILKARAPDFARCLTEKMLTYALGRGLDEADHCAVDQIVRSLESDRYRFMALVFGIVKSDPFQKRRP
jgi:mono/diheme cytochrome c family protein